MKCESCDSIYINGGFCHETGCPDAWKETSRDCFVCGFEFVPSAKIQMVCDDCTAEEEDYAGSIV